MNGNQKVLNCKDYLSSVVWYNTIERNLYLFIGFLDVSYLLTGWYVLPHWWLRHHVRPKCWWIFMTFHFHIPNVHSHWHRSHRHCLVTSILCVLSNISCVTSVLQRNCTRSLRCGLSIWSVLPVVSYTHTFFTVCLLTLPIPLNI